MIYITGDTHGMEDWEKINTTNFPIQKVLTKNDYLIITGDFGGVWDGAEQDRYILKSYDQRPFTTLLLMAITRITTFWISILLRNGTAGRYTVFRTVLSI